MRDIGEPGVGQQLAELRDGVDVVNRRGFEPLVARAGRWTFLPAESSAAVDGTCARLGSTAIGESPADSSARQRVPERLVVAVEDLDVRPADRILEIGCGRGVAAALICRRLDGGHLVAIDRSAKAIAAATVRNADAIAAGTVEFGTTALEDVEPAALGRFDKILAINVNLFWVRPAHRELQLVAQMLEPDGLLRLCYDPPDAARLTQLETTLVEHLEHAGYRCTSATLATVGQTLLSVTAQPL